MNGENVVRFFEIRTAQGELLAIVQAKEVACDPKAQDLSGEKKADSQPEEKRSRGNGPEPLMTDPQKRYLFRLLAEQGIENEAAHEELKKRFKVNNLKEVAKVEASKEIERILASQKGGESHAH